MMDAAELKLNRAAHQGGAAHGNHDFPELAGGGPADFRPTRSIVKSRPTQSRKCCGCISPA